MAMALALFRCLVITLCKLSYNLWKNYTIIGACGSTAPFFYEYSPDK